MLKLKIAKKQLELYLVTDRTWLGNRTLEDCVEQAILGGVTIIQLREKNLNDDDFIKLAKKIKQVCHHHHIPLIINDNLKVALAVDSDGIHIGQDDLPVSFVREKIGPDKILGVTAHNLQEALQAQNDGADYLGAGAIFNTTTKNNTTDLSIEHLKEITNNVTIPVVAIGGINKNNCHQLSNCNLAGIAVVSAIMNNDNIQEATKQLKKISKVVYE